MTHHVWRPSAGHTYHISTTVNSHSPVGRASPTSRSRRRARSDDKNVPRFLRQSHAEIRRKFLELENLQNERLFVTINGNPPESQWHVDDSPVARMRDRYSNIHAWERNRIHLDVPPEYSDYINASPILLPHRKDGALKRYIAMQGPKEGQFSHLWRMVWRETGNTAVIVMLTKTSELGRDKCFQYFPEDDGVTWEIHDNGEFNDGFEASVILLEARKDVKSACVVRKLLMRVGDREKTVWHLLFEGWPDYNVPEGDDKAALLELIKLANAKNVPESPLIVHCSAGVGRSGTFITLDHFLREIDAGTISVDEREDLVFNTVNYLREQRMSMVQSQVQYEFIYQVLKERFGRRGKSASPASLHAAETGELSPTSEKPASI